MPAISLHRDQGPLSGVGCWNFDALMYLPVEYVQTSFNPIDKQSAIKALDDQIDKLEMTDDAANLCSLI